MSTNYHILCETCGKRLDFRDANWQDDMMLVLCQHSDEIAAMADTLDEIGGQVELNSQWRLDHDWFRRHLGHELIPIDEYGRRIGQCRKPNKCECAGGHLHPCGLDDGHEGECKLTYRSNPWRQRRKDTGP